MFLYYMGAYSTEQKLAYHLLTVYLTRVDSVWLMSVIVHLSFREQMFDVHITFLLDICTQSVKRAQIKQYCSMDYWTIIG